MSENKKNWHKFKEENKGQDEMSPENAEFEEPIAVEEPESHEEGLEHLSYEELASKLTQAEQNAHENWEKSVRALAELDNVRRRAEREVSNAHRYGVEKLINSLLPVVDSLEQALQMAKDDKAMEEGLELTMKLFLDALQKYDVQQLDPLGTAFDPQEHEAMSIQEVAGAEPNSVIAVFQKGYKLADRVIRPARVIVAKK